MGVGCLRGRVLGRPIVAAAPALLHLLETGADGLEFLEDGVIGVGRTRGGEFVRFEGGSEVCYLGLYPVIDALVDFVDVGRAVITCGAARPVTILLWRRTLMSRLLKKAT